MSAHGVHITKDGDQRARAVATLLLGVAALGVWAPILGSGILWALPVLAASTWLVARGAAPRSVSFQLGLVAAWPAWVLLSLLLAGLPPSVLSIGELGATANALSEAVVNLRNAAPGDPWSVAAWIAGSGSVWFFGAIQASRPNRTSAAIAFFMLSMPFCSALLLQQAEDAPWQGAVVLAAALLWATRSELRAALPAIGVVAVVGLVVSAVIGPSEKVFSLSGIRPPAGASLNGDLTFGPQNDNGRGAKMLEVTSPKGRQWRMQTLDWFDGRTWRVDPRLPDDNLPQPAAVQTKTTVRLRELRDVKVAAPGRVVSAALGAGGMSADPGRGETFAFVSPPTDQYTTISELVDPPVDQLEGVEIPVGREYVRYKELYDESPRDLGTPLAARAEELPPDSGWGQVYRLARDLSAGTKSQLEVVENVKSYLLSDTFRYSLTDAPQAGSDPLVDFLTVSHVGYCQHFAGAAALLLRLAGVPVRVAVGFAMGQSTEQDTYEVTDADAHAWIEVYFPGSGWVTFDPTPPDTQARTAPDVTAAAPPEKTAESSSAAKHSSATGAIVLGVLVALGVLMAVWRRFRVARDADPLGEVLIRLVPAPAGPAMTFAELRRDLAAIGPAVAALAEEAEWQRFGTSTVAPEPKPRRRVLRALLRDLGLPGAAKLLLLGPGRRPVIDEEAAALAARSIAPPSAGPPGSPPPPRLA